MSTDFNNNENLKPNFDLNNFDANALISVNFNFDILQTAISELIKNHKNIKDELKAIKSDLLLQKKNSNEIKLSFLELKLSTEKNPENHQDIENQKKMINSEIIELKKQIDDLENKFIKNINLEMNNSSTNINKEKNVKKENNIEANNNNISNNQNNIENKESKEIIKENKISFNKDEYKKIISKETEPLINDIKNNFNSKIKLFEKTLNNKIVKDENDINAIKENFEKEISEMKKNMSEIDNNKKTISEMISNYEILISKVNTLNDSFSFYTKLNDFKQNRNETYEYIKGIKDDINKNVEINRRGLSSLRNQYNDHIKDKSDHIKLNLLSEKFEILQSMYYKFSDFQRLMEEKERRKVILDPNDFINKETFNEFLNNEKKNLDDIKRENFELKKDVNLLINSDKGNKASLKDLKSLEDKILKLFDELKVSISKKYVDKNTLNKNSKLMEMQTKKLIEENKKFENKENWLLSKKPIGGHLCASCESYIGDLNSETNSKYIPWNKYPQKESSEKIYKVEGGISKIFNIFNSKLNQLNSNYNKNNNNSSSIENSADVLKTNIEENSKQTSTKDINDSSYNLNCFSCRANRKKKFKIINHIEEMDNINNLPMIQKSIKKNNSMTNVFNSENVNQKNSIQNFGFNSSSNFNKNPKDSSPNRSIQIGYDEEFNLNSRKKGIYSRENLKELYKPIITRIIKKH